MCRLLAYLGPPIRLGALVEEPEHSLVVQSYQPRLMTSGLLNADGFGFGWYDAERDAEPFRFRSTQPIWSDGNFPTLARYVRSGCLLANVRSATPGQAVDLSNCQPFVHEQIMGIHNGFIENFRASLQRPIRDSLDDAFYRRIQGSTDSEHLFALVLNIWERLGGSLEDALTAALSTLTDWAAKEGVTFSANTVFSDGRRLVASRFANRETVPSLWWLAGDPDFPESVIVASEPFSDSGHWQEVPVGSLVVVEADVSIRRLPL